MELAARLAKCDLVTQMVGEFPDLQGQVGADYARRQGQEEFVAAAIEDHYQPVGADDSLPSTMIGMIVGLADRLDTICGLFGVGQTPTGAADPYALRRAAIAIIRCVTELGVPVYLAMNCRPSLGRLEPWLKRPAAEVKGRSSLFRRPLSGVLGEKWGVPTDVAQAVLAAGLTTCGGWRHGARPWPR